MAVNKVEPKIVSQESYKAEANTTAVNYKSINPFSKETPQPAPKKTVSSALFANVEDAYVKNMPKTKNPLLRWEDCLMAENRLPSLRLR